jgi:protein-tyrosine-phosphatase
MIRILFVCTGNVCRSPMAEGLLRKLLREQGVSGDFVVESAGTAPMPGAPATGASVDVCAAEGIDLRGHAARAVTKRIISRADLILTLEPVHRDRIMAAFPEAADKCFVITAYSDEGMESGIADPIGLPLEEYQETFRQIEASIQAALPRILALLGEGTASAGDRTV